MEPHHVWAPGPGEARREALAVALYFARRPAWIVVAALCVLYVVVSSATRHGDAAHYAMVLVPIAILALVYVVTWWGLRRIFVPGARWTSTFGPEAMTTTSPLGRSELLYSQMRRIRHRGPFIVIHLRPAGRIMTYRELVPPAAEAFLRARIRS